MKANDICIIPEYCYRVEVEEYVQKLRKKVTVLRDCHKLTDVSLDGLHPYISHVRVCTVWEDPCLKMGVNRGGYLGCAFSPLERRADIPTGKMRVGQQKQRSWR